MSQDEPKQSESVKLTPKTPNVSSTTNKSGTSLKQATQVAQQTWKRTQPVLKVQGIKVLRGTINLLEKVADKLEAQPIEPASSSLTPPVVASPPQVVVSKPVDSTTATSETVINLDTADTSKLNETRISEIIEITPKTPQQILTTPVTDSQESTAKPTTFVDRFMPSFQSVQTAWNGVLKLIRGLLPASANQKLSDWGLTGAIATTIVLILWLSVAVVPGKPVDVTKLPPEEIQTPSELKAPKKPEPVEIVSPTPAVLTPEQNLIASIQNQVTGITNQYADGLIQSLEVNFPKSLLIIKVSSDWYDIKPGKQDKLADEMLSRSAEMDFSKLEITDTKGNIVARSPVVGTHMVILKRQLENLDA
ncbi:MAG TPA: hypothetical protein V6D15_04305 [Oculatellaceae cyanobacterium]|jgi:hypothetical protein